MELRRRRDVDVEGRRGNVGSGAADRRRQALVADAMAARTGGAVLDRSEVEPFLCGVLGEL